MRPKKKKNENHIKFKNPYLRKTEIEHNKARVSSAKKAITKRFLTTKTSVRQTRDLIKPTVRT